MSLSFRLQKHSKALMFLNCASPERQMTRQRFLKWTQPAKSRPQPRLAAPQNQALTHPSGASGLVSTLVFGISPQCILVVGIDFQFLAGAVYLGGSEALVALRVDWFYAQNSVVV